MPKKRDILLVLMLALFLIGCKEASKEENSLQLPQKSLSELQVTACDAADKANTCDTRLAEIGIVSKEDCCKELGKCC